MEFIDFVNNFLHCSRCFFTCAAINSRREKKMSSSLFAERTSTLLCRFNKKLFFVLFLFAQKFSHTNYMILTHCCSSFQRRFDFSLFCLFKITELTLFPFTRSKELCWRISLKKGSKAKKKWWMDKEIKDDETQTAANNNEFMRKDKKNEWG